MLAHNGIQMRSSMSNSFNIYQCLHYFSGSNTDIVDIWSNLVSPQMETKNWVLMLLQTHIEFFHSPHLLDLTTQMPQRARFYPVYTTARMLWWYTLYLRQHDIANANYCLLATVSMFEGYQPSASLLQFYVNYFKREWF